MLGASAFGWPYLGEVALDDAYVPTIVALETDSRFGVAMMGWPYLGALPGIYQYVQPPPPAFVETPGADIGADLYQGGPLFPVTRLTETERKKKFWPVLPKTFEDAEEISVVTTTTEDGAVKIIAPAPIVTPDETKPERETFRPDEPAKPGVVVSPGVQVRKPAEERSRIDKKMMIKLAEERAFFGLGSENLPKEARKIREDLTILKGDLEL